MRLATVTFRIHLYDGRSLEHVERIEYQMWHAQQDFIHLFALDRMRDRGGVWEGNWFHPWHFVRMVEWLGSEPEPRGG